MKREVSIALILILIVAGVLFGFYITGQVTEGGVSVWFESTDMRSNDTMQDLSCYISGPDDAYMVQVSKNGEFSMEPLFEMDPNLAKNTFEEIPSYSRIYVTNIVAFGDYIYVAGKFYSSSTSSRIYVMRYNLDGELIDVDLSESSNFVGVYETRIDGDRLYIKNFRTLPGSGNANQYITVYDLDGNVVSELNAGTGSVYDYDVDPDGNFYVALINTLDSYYPNGTLRWSVSKPYSTPRAFRLMENGELYYIAGSRSTPTKNLFWLYRYDTDGNLIGNKTFDYYNNTVTTFFHGFFEDADQSLTLAVSYAIPNGPREYVYLDVSSDLENVGYNVVPAEDSLVSRYNFDDEGRVVMIKQLDLGDGTKTYSVKLDLDTYESTKELLFPEYVRPDDWSFKNGRYYLLLSKKGQVYSKGFYFNEDLGERTLVLRIPSSSTSINDTWECSVTSSSLIEPLSDTIVVNQNGVTIESFTDDNMSTGDWTELKYGVSCNLGDCGMINVENYFYADEKSEGEDVVEEDETVILDFGFNHTFSESMSAYPDCKDSLECDCLSDTFCLTLGAGLFFNPVSQVSEDRSCLIENSEWAAGQCGVSDSFATFCDVLSTYPDEESMSSSINCLHVLDTDEYYNLRFDYFGRGEIYYHRSSSPVPFVEPELDPSLMKFVKEDFASYSYPECKNLGTCDCFNDEVCIARADKMPLFNPVSQVAEDNLNDCSANVAGTEWADGKCVDAEEFYPLFETQTFDCYPTEAMNKPLCMHILGTDEYYDFVFKSWTSGAGGGGFSYERSKESVDVDDKLFLINITELHELNVTSEGVNVSIPIKVNRPLNYTLDINAYGSALVAINSDLKIMGNFYSLEKPVEKVEEVVEEGVEEPSGSTGVYSTIKEVEGVTYSVSPNSLSLDLILGESEVLEFGIESDGSETTKLKISVSGDVSNFISIEDVEYIVSRGNNPFNFDVIVPVVYSKGVYSGEIVIGEPVNENIPVVVTVLEEVAVEEVSLVDEVFVVDVNEVKTVSYVDKESGRERNVDVVSLSMDLDYVDSLIYDGQTLGVDYDVLDSFEEIKYSGETEIIPSAGEVVRASFDIPSNLKSGEYSIETEIKTPDNFLITGKHSVMIENEDQKLPIVPTVVVIGLILGMGIVLWIVLRNKED